MNGLQRVMTVLSGRPADRPPVMPIAHSALATCAGIPLEHYYTDGAAMAEAIMQGQARFGFDGVQLSLGVTAEAQALGARVDQPAGGAPLLREHLLKDPAQLAGLQRVDPRHRGRMPLYHTALREVCRRIGDEVFVLSTLRGPLNIASQLRGVEDLLVDMLQAPAQVEEILDFATDTAIAFAALSRDTGAHGLIFGEATCSPSFISPVLYRRLVLPRHTRLIAAVKTQGWQWVGFHICGNLLPILEDVLSTGATLVDIDHQVDAAEALRRTAGRACLRGNLDPIGVFYTGDRRRVLTATEELLSKVAGAAWIVSTGCDIPPGTPSDLLDCWMEALRTRGPTG